LTWLFRLYGYAALELRHSTGSPKLGQQIEQQQHAPKDGVRGMEVFEAESISLHFIIINAGWSLVSELKGYAKFPILGIDSRHDLRP
jgi:hypothetical protein